MTRVERLERDLADARRRISELVAMNRIHVFHHAFALERADAKMLLALYEAGGRPVSIAALLLVTSPDPARQPKSNLIRVRACQIRRALQEGAVQMVIGVGYALTPSGLAEVADVLGKRIGDAA